MSRAAQGLRAWLVQRFTAVYLALYLLVLLPYLWFLAPVDYLEWRALLAHPAGFVSTALFALAVLLHAWVGVRDVLMDYVHAVWLRLSLLALIALLLAGSLGWVLRALTLASGAS
jgi:succinate dehydrogenase / fumarate reductase, membrane anchor subunit